MGKECLFASSTDLESSGLSDRDPWCSSRQGPYIRFGDKVSDTEHSLASSVTHPRTKTWPPVTVAHWTNRGWEGGGGGTTSPGT